MLYCGCQWLWREWRKSGRTRLSPFNSTAFITREFRIDGYVDTYIYTKTVRVWYDSAYYHTMDSIKISRARKDSLRRVEEMNKKEAARLADSAERARKEFLHHYFWPDDF